MTWAVAKRKGLKCRYIGPDRRRFAPKPAPNSIHKRLCACPPEDDTLGRSSSVLVGPRRSSSVLVGPRRSSSVLVGPRRSSSVLTGPHRSSPALTGPHRPSPDSEILTFSYCICGEPLYEYSGQMNCGLCLFDCAWSVADSISIYVMSAGLTGEEAVNHCEYRVYTACPGW
jgi:hypothetical protein